VFDSKEPVKMIRFPDNNKVSLIFHITLFINNDRFLCQLTQFQMLLPASNAPESPTVTGRMSKKKFNISHLPTEITLQIFENLDVFDSAALALTCKHMAAVAVTHSQLNMSVEAMAADQSYKPHEVGHFLKKRLDASFFPKSHRYCWLCRVYLPRRKSYWKRKLGQKCWIPAPRVRGRSRVSLTLTQWWDLPQTQKMLESWLNNNAQHCPRCRYLKAGFQYVGRKTDSWVRAAGYIV
jgi:F-box-like